MDIKELKKLPGQDPGRRLVRLHAQLTTLLEELRGRELSVDVIGAINQEIDRVNAASGTHKAFRKQLKNSQTQILQLLRKELNLVTKYYYRNTWMALGMAAFGIPIGAAIGASLGNMAFLGIGLPIGFAVGLAVGSEMDRKAREAGRQMETEIKYS